MTLPETLAVICHASDRIRARMPAIQSGNARDLEVLAADLADLSRHAMKALNMAGMEFIRRGGR